MKGDNVNQFKIDAHDGAQVIIASDSAAVHAIQNNGNESVINRPKIKSRTQEYADKWNQNMFLNDFDEWDEKAGVNVKLKDVYLENHLPHFIYGGNEKTSTNLKRFLSKYIYEKDENKMLLILGQPGIGKSTLITWITANFVDRVDDILVYKFADDLKNIDWQKPNISNEILNVLNLSYNDLNGKTIFFDGFDEVSIEANRRRDILDNLYNDLSVKRYLSNTLIKFVP